jgi:hypothetical protein
MAIAGKMITQGEVSEQTGIPRPYLNSFLRRKLNLLNSDMEKLMDALEFKEGVKEKLSIVASIPSESVGTGKVGNE